MTDGDDPSVVDPPFKKTATWNSVDMTQGLPKVSLKKATKAAEAMEFAYEAYTSGRKKASEGNE